MTVLNNLKIKGQNYAYCIGDELSADFKCSALIRGNDKYVVESVGVGNSFSDVLYALIRIVGNVEIPKGKVEVV